MATAPLNLLWFHWQLAADMLSMMDQRADPCVDFYEYACGNFVRNTRIPDDKSMVFSLTQMHDRMMEQLRNVIESDQKNDDPASAKFAKGYYKTCMDIPALEDTGLNQLKETLRKFQGWPVLDGPDWNGSTYNWMLTNAKLMQETGVSPIISFYVMADFKNSTKRMLQVDQPRLGLGKRDYYLDKNNTKTIEAYRKFIRTTAVQLGADNATAAREADEMVEFETALANISMRDEDRRDVEKRYAPTRIQELKVRYPKLDFQAWFDYAASLDWILNDETINNAAGASYLGQLSNVFYKFSIRTIANYQMWMLVQDLVQYLAPSLREHLREFRHALFGTPKFEPRWKECLADLKKNVAWPLSSIYVKHYFDGGTKADIDQMMQNIRKSMKPTVENVKWMDDSTKRHAHEKLTNMIDNIAYPPDKIYNETWLMRDYKRVDLQPGRYMLNYLSISASTNDRKRSEFYEPINRTEWNSATPAVINAFYSTADNKMAFPAGILRYPFYNLMAPAFVNYGRIGVVMGHELTHGFDDQGRQFDSEGNYVLWWTNETLAEFKKGAKCFINQYGNIVDKITGHQLNGENIADNGGVKLAHKAFQLWTASAPESAASSFLPGFQNFTADQIFFLSYAQVWCQAIRTPALRVQIVRDQHAPARYRANVPLKNYEAFAAAYKCPAGSPMNPTEKCAIW